MEIQIQANVKEVTVYPDRARVTMSGECEVAPGLHRLLVDDLPLTMETDSVRVTGKGTARVRVLSVDVVSRYYTETPAERVKQLEQEVQAMDDEGRVIADTKAGLSERAKYLAGLRQATLEFAKGLSRGRTTVENQVQLLDFMRREDEAIRQETRDLDNQQRDLNRRLEKARQELKGYQSQRPRQRYQGQIEVEVLTAGTFWPALHFVVRNAGWQPLYDVRLLEEANGRSLEVSYIAQVTQNSGQDWLGVQLVVSTARPALNQRLPDLAPWYLDVYTPPPPPMPKKAMLTRAAAPAPRDMMREESGAEKGDYPEAEPMMLLDEAPMSVATVQDSGTAVSYIVGGQSDIPSDGTPHKTTINQFRLDPKLDYLAVPKHTDSVYRRATVKNTSSGPLLAGGASLYVGDEFIGRTQIKHTATNGEIELLLGVEERVTVKRELEKREVDKRFLRDNRVLLYGYKIEIKNLLPGEAKVEVHDHIPVSRHEQIKVKLESSKPEPSKKTDLNVLEWQVTLPANQEQVVRYEYTVDHPRSLQVVGLID